MKSKDVKELMREELAQKFNSALESGDAEQVAQAFADMADNILDLCQYFGQKKSKDYAVFLSSSSSFCCGVK